MEALLSQGFSALKFCPFDVYEKKTTEQIIRIYAGFYQFIEALVKYCLFYGLIVTSRNLEVKQVPSVCFVVCLITSLEPCPTKKQQIYKLNKKKMEV